MIDIRTFTHNVDECDQCAPMEIGNDTGFAHIPIDLAAEYHDMESPNADFELRVNEMRRELEGKQPQASNRKSTRKGKGKGKSRLTKREDPAARHKRDVLNRIAAGDIDALLEDF